jgi:hypothetical protein
LINVARTVLLEISYALKAGLRRLALLNRLKHRWRRRGAGAASARRKIGPGAADAGPPASAGSLLATPEHASLTTSDA